MNAANEVTRLLKDHHAVLVRQNKHLVYRLPNGQNFVVAKTSSDPDRAAKNNLSDLRRALGIPRETPRPKGDAAMPIEPKPTRVVPAPPTPKEELLKARVELAIAREEAAQEKLLSEAQAVERRIQMLKAVLPFTEDPAIEASLRALLPAAEPPPPSALPPEPPQQITERVQVTRQLVLAATQTFEETFTVNDVMALMTGSRQIDPRERLRIRSSIAQSVTTLFDRGELVREAEGYGKRQAVWRRAALNGTVNRACAGT